MFADAVRVNDTFGQSVSYSAISVCAIDASTTRGCTCCMILRRRLLGRMQSIANDAVPAFMTVNIDTGIHSDFSKQRGTITLGPTPGLTRCWVSLLAAASSSL